MHNIKNKKAWHCKFQWVIQVTIIHLKAVEYLNIYPNLDLRKLVSIGMHGYTLHLTRWRILII